MQQTEEMAAWCLKNTIFPQWNRLLLYTGGVGAPLRTNQWLSRTTNGCWWTVAQCQVAYLGEGPTVAPTSG